MDSDLIEIKKHLNQFLRYYRKLKYSERRALIKFAKSEQKTLGYEIK